MDSYRKAGEFFGNGTQDTIKNCFRLAALEREWHKVAGNTIAEVSSVNSCEFTEEGIKVTIHVKDASLVQALKFRRVFLSSAIKKFFKTDSVILDIKAGKVKKQSTAKEALPEYKKRVPIVISEEKIEEEKKKILEISSDIDPSLAETLAKIKLSSEKLNSMGKSKR